MLMMRLANQTQPVSQSGKSTSDMAQLLDRLNAHLLPLVGEPFQLARISYGDELTLHFGGLRPARSPRLSRKLYGEYILGTRASAWLWKSKSGGLIVNDIAPIEPIEDLVPLSVAEVESGPFMPPGAQLLRITAAHDRTHNTIALVLSLSDGSVFSVIPRRQPEPESELKPPGNASPQGSDEQPPAGAEVADWEIITPAGLIEAGPGLKWRFEPKATPAADGAA